MMPHHRINRNIVECKYELPTSLNISGVVLIETLWNVNTFMILLLRLHFRINRNIVECKCGGASTAFSTVLVLIETLWNVNETEN